MNMINNFWNYSVRKCNETGQRGLM